MPQGLDQRVASVLTSALNASKSKASWKNHEVAIRHIEKAQEEFGIRMAIPFTKKMVWAYVAFLKQRGMKADSIKNYLSAVRSEHLVRGYCPEGLMPDLLGQFLDGMRKLGNQEGRNKERGAITMERLMIIRQWIKRNIVGKGFRAVIWLTCAWLFWGALRPNEALSLAHDKFAVDRTLQGRDVREGSVVDEEGRTLNCLFLKIKKPKEAKGADTEIELIENGSKSCPWKAWTFFKKTKDGRVKSFEPVLRKPDGSLVTAKDIQEVLNGSLGHLLGKKEFLSTHSFRSGLATELAQQGMEDEEIMRQGRWKSSAFQTYVKLGRKNRTSKQIAIAKKIVRRS